MYWPAVMLFLVTVVGRVRRKMTFLVGLLTGVLARRYTTRPCGRIPTPFVEASWITRSCVLPVQGSTSSAFQEIEAPRSVDHATARVSATAPTADTTPQLTLSTAIYAGSLPGAV
jgi:hypothetical protein